MIQIQGLEPRILFSFDPTAREQESLELINRLRYNPAAELPRILASNDWMTQFNITYFQVNKSMLRQQWAALKKAAPLAWAPELYGTATAHSKKSVQADRQAHNLPGELQFGARIKASGYVNSGASENVYAYAANQYHGYAGFAIDWGYGPGGIQSGVGHRKNLMNPAWREIGIGIADVPKGHKIGPTVVTEDFGKRKVIGNSFLLGVVYKDTNKNGIYNAGEGLGHAKITITGNGHTYTTTGLTAGGYQIALPRGTYTVTTSGAGLKKPIVAKNVYIGGDNVKRDFVLSASGVGSVTAMSVTSSDESAPPTSGSGSDTSGGTSGGGTSSGNTNGGVTGGVKTPTPGGGSTSGNGSATPPDDLPTLPDPTDGDLGGTDNNTGGSTDPVVPQDPTSSSPPPVSSSAGRSLDFGNGQKTSYTDADGDVVTLSLKGPGIGTVFLGANDSDALSIVLNGTTGASRLKIGTHGHTSVGDITVHGSLKQLKAASTDLTGSMTVDGSLSKLQLADASGGNTITIGSDAHALSAKFDSVSDLSIESAARIVSLKAQEWRDTDGAADIVSAPSFSKVKIAGDFEADLDAIDSIKQLSVGGDLTDSQIHAGSTIGNVSADTIAGSQLLAGVDPGATPANLSDFTDTDSRIKSVKTTSFSDAIIAAASIDKLRLGAIATNNNGAIFGAIADEIGSLKGRDAEGESVKLKHADNPGDAMSNGDFEVTAL